VKFTAKLGLFVNSIMVLGLLGNMRNVYNISMLDE